MFGWFKQGGKTAKPSLDSIRFDVAGYTPQGEPQPGKVRAWYTPEGDGLEIHFFSVPPDLPRNAASVDELAAIYRDMLSYQANLVEVRVVKAGGGSAVRTIQSFPQSPSGRTFVGWLTIPFRDFGYLLKCQCPEHGTTGVKAALLFERSRAANEPMTIEGGRFYIPGFDPDDPKHDVDFPHDPVARVRRVLDHVAGSLVVADEVRQLPGFPLP